MMNRADILLGLVVATLSSQSAVAQRIDKPVKETVLHVDYKTPPAGAAEMASAAAGVVVAEWTGRARLDASVSPEGFPLPTRTLYTFRVLEIVKLHALLPLVGGEFELSLPGGDKDRLTYVERVRDPGTTEFRPNRKYVLFVAWDSRTNELYLAWGAFGVYDITSGRVTSLGKAWQRHNGRDPGEFLSTIRRAE